MNYAFTLPNNDKFAHYTLIEFINFIKSEYPELSIVGIDKDPNGNYDASQSIHAATKGSVISIGSDQKFDVDWYPSVKHALADGVRVDGELPMNWISMTKFLNNFSNKKRMNRYSGASIARPTYVKPVCDCAKCRLRNMCANAKVSVSTGGYTESNISVESNQFYTRIGEMVIPHSAPAPVRRTPNVAFGTLRVIRY